MPQRALRQRALRQRALLRRAALVAGMPGAYEVYGYPFLARRPD